MVRRLTLSGLMICALAFAACAAPPAAPAVNAPDDVAAINALRTKFEAAFGSSDPAAVAALYTTDAVLAENHQPTATGRDGITKYFEGVFSQVSIKLQLRAEETKTFGDHAYDRGQATFTVTPKAPGATPLPAESGRYLVLIRKDADGQWRVSHDYGNSATPMPTPAPEPAPAAKKGK